ncbi:putative uncharacterized protein ENSP00000383309 [Tigriopus californicus]|uniref:putative uncharacterized protein ENSP00000383309 n=1 Tax=Tigriopus californicus TaxID=6832 RepID=UPI0027D9DF36|nr:putative uncharacterized protein ENSP00000383309 [Tigriopus californicus]
MPRSRSSSSSSSSSSSRSSSPVDDRHATQSRTSRKHSRSHPRRQASPEPKRRHARHRSGSRKSAKRGSHRADHRSPDDRRRRAKKSKKDHRHSSRRRSVSRSPSRSRSRSPPKKSRKDRRPPRSSRSRSRSRDRRRRSKDRRSDRRSPSGVRSPVDPSEPQTGVPSSVTALPGGPGLGAQVDAHEVAVQQTRRDLAIASIESSSGFEPASFVSSSQAKVAAIALPGEAPPAVTSGFEFGTAFEKKASTPGQRLLDQMSADGLCHPSLFGGEAEKEERWVRHLFQLRKKLMTSGS